VKTANTVAVLAIAMLTNGCAGTAAKTLTERTARDLIRNYLHDQKLAPQFSLREVQDSMGKGKFLDYSAMSANPPISIDWRSLIEQKLVTQTVRTTGGKTVYDYAFSEEFQKKVIHSR
jgi:hypothetical protein